MSYRRPELDAEFAQGLKTFSNLLQRRMPLIEEASAVDSEEAALPSQQKILTCEKWKNDIKQVLFSEHQISMRVRELAAEISADYAGENVICVGLLNGAVVFATDLLRRLTVQYELDFIRVSSYQGDKSTGQVALTKDMSINPKGRHVLIVEDLIDSGLTLQWILAHIKSKDVKSVRIACLLDKKVKRTSPVRVDYSGWECPDEFVVGYGMDFNEQFRCLPFVGILRPEAYQ